MPSSKILLISGILVFAVLIVIAVVLVIIGVVRPVGSPGAKCTVNNQCTSTQTCNDNGICEEITCDLSSDCPNDQICALGFCYQRTCDPSPNIHNYCTSPGQICVSSNSEVSFGNEVCAMNFTGACETNNDCYGGTLLCKNGACVECINDGDCGDSSKFCGADKVCYYQCTDPSSTGQTGTSPILGLGVCQEDYTCVNNVCCPTDFEAQTCGGSDETCLPGSYCVNGNCSCKPGTYGDYCSTNNDCASTNCLGTVCANSGDGCFYNYNTAPDSTQVGVCPADLPFCASGKCSTTSIGAPCTAFINTGATGQLFCEDGAYCACNQGQTGYYTVPAGTYRTSYCVNNFCSANPGWYGAVCTTNSDCLPVSQPVGSCTNGFCI